MCEQGSLVVVHKSDSVVGSERNVRIIEDSAEVKSRPSLAGVVERRMQWHIKECCLWLR